jgi:hypothetical protein
MPSSPRRPSKNDADLLLGRELPPGDSPDVPDGLLRALRSLFVSLSPPSLGLR